MSHLVCLLAVLSIGCSSVCAFYIPGVTPYNYKEDEPVAIKVNSLTSQEALLPKPFYSFKGCKPSDADIKKLRKRENLGEILFGDRIEPSLYFAEMKVNASCRVLCSTVSYNEKEQQELEKLIETGYKGKLILDNLPVAQKIGVRNQLQPKVQRGYPLGIPKKYSTEQLLKGKGQAYVNNHLQFTIGYHRPEFLQEFQEDELERYRIVYFYVEPMSIRWSSESKCSGMDQKKPMRLSALEMHPAYVTDPSITWTYSVVWIDEPDLIWATRWDIYMKGGEAEGRVHWVSIINSLIILMLLSAMAAMILMRTLHKDFNTYNDPNYNEEAQDETGWKLCHADVFRTPPNATVLVTQLGSGIQLIGTTMATLIFACAGFLSPSNRGGLATSMILLFVLLGSYAGYVSARLLKMMGLQSWQRIFCVAVAFPGVMLSLYLILNFFCWAEHSTSAVPIKTLLLLVVLWLFISVSLTVVGASFGYKREAITYPCTTHSRARQIPEKKWYLRPAVAIPVGGILPFGAAFIELIFIFSSIWQGRIYYVFGFLALVFTIVAVTCAEISIVMTYFQLCREDYEWWHRSYYISASSGLHLFLYACYYFHTALGIQQFSSTVIYFGYSAMIALCFSLVTGTIGFFGAFFFVRKIYGAIKID